MTALAGGELLGRHRRLAERLGFLDVELIRAALQDRRGVCGHSSAKHVLRGCAAHQGLQECVVHDGLRNRAGRARHGLERRPVLRERRRLNEWLGVRPELGCAVCAKMRKPLGANRGGFGDTAPGDQPGWPLVGTSSSFALPGPALLGLATVTDELPDGRAAICGSRSSQHIGRQLRGPSAPILSTVNLLSAALSRFVRFCFQRRRQSKRLATDSLRHSER